MMVYETNFAFCNHFNMYGVVHKVYSINKKPTEIMVGLGIKAREALIF